MCKSCAAIISLTFSGTAGVCVYCSRPQANKVSAPGKEDRDKFVTRTKTQTHHSISHTDLSFMTTYKRDEENLFVSIVRKTKTPKTPAWQCTTLGTKNDVEISACGFKKKRIVYSMISLSQTVIIPTG